MESHKKNDINKVNTYTNMKITSNIKRTPTVETVSESMSGGKKYI